MVMPDPESCCGWRAQSFSYLGSFFFPPVEESLDLIYQQDITIVPD